MNSEEKIKELEERIVKLEKIEKRRKITKYISIGIKVLIIIVIGIFVYKAYTIIDSYKQQIDKITNIQNGLDSSGDYLQEQLDKLKDIKIFN